MHGTLIAPDFVNSQPLQHFPANRFPAIHPIHWLYSHFAVGGWSPLQRLSGMVTAHMTTITPHNGFTWHPHRGLEIYTWVLEGTLSHEDTTGGRGEIGPGEFQRMFSGEWIEHQELNRGDVPVRVIQIWYVADLRYRGLLPHYQQMHHAQLPSHQIGQATVFSLIGDGSPMEQHMRGRLSATWLDPGGRAPLEPPAPDEDLFLYVTDGSGKLAFDGREASLGQYDVVLARTNAPQTSFTASPAEPLRFLGFYLPRFLG